MIAFGSTQRPTGVLTPVIIRGKELHEESRRGPLLGPNRRAGENNEIGQGSGLLPLLIRQSWPIGDIHRDIKAYRLTNYRRLLKPMLKLLMARSLGLSFLSPSLHAVIFRANGQILDLGLVSLKFVTTAGVNFLCDAFQGTTEPELFHFHGLGLGVVAENITDVALGTELTTQYNPDSTRANGSLAEGASANIFRTVATNTVDAAAAVTEHGIFSQAAVPGGTLWDRSQFSAINLANGDGLQTTYDLTINAGG